MVPSVRFPASTSTHTLVAMVMIYLVGNLVDMWDPYFEVEVSSGRLPTPFPCYERLNSSCEGLELRCNHIKLLHDGEGRAR